MKKKKIKFIVGMLLSAGVMAGVLYLNWPAIEAWMAEEEAERQAWEVYTQKEEKTQNLTMDEAEEPGITAKQFCLDIPEGILAEEITVSNDYLTRTVRIEIPHVDDSYFQSQPLSGRSDNVAELTYAQGKEYDVIELVMDYVYELEISHDEAYYYFDFIEPQEIYDSVVVIDAGHGGRDPGANRQGILEKDIDLAIALELKAIFDASDENIGVYYTRIDDSNPSNTQRVELANKSKADLFISIHINSYKGSRDSSINGTEVMYSSTHEGELTSKQLAEICMEELTAALESRDRGLITGDNIYIINQSEVPVALVEIGFITNKEERELLNSKDYQKKTAEALYEAVIRALGEQ